MASSTSSAIRAARCCRSMTRLFQQDDVQHILVRHEQGAGHAAEGYARSTGKAGVMLVTSGPGRDQCGDAAAGRADGFDPAGLHHRPGADLADRLRRLPGMRHGRHHAALHQAQLAGEGRQRPGPRSSTRPSTSPRPAVPGPVVVDIPKDVQFATGTYAPPQTAPRTSYQPKVQGDLDKIKAAVELMATRQAADHLYRRRRHQFRPGGQPSAARTGRPDRLPDHLDADGARRLSGLGQELARHARHARHLRSQHGDARLRRHDLHRRALRRPHHRPAQCVLAEFEEDPHRHRSVVDQQERARRRADHRRCRPRAGGHGPAVAGDRPKADKKAL